MTETLLTKPPKAGCTQTVEDARGLAVLIGDSNAGQFTEGFMAAALRAHLDARVATRGSCAFTDLAVYDAQDKSECNPYVEASLDELVRLRPRIVFIARNSDGYVEVPRFKIAARDGTFTETDPAIKASAWRAADMRMIRRLEAAGAEVVLINPVPKFPGWDTVDLAPVRLLLPLRFVQQTYPREYALNARARATVAEEEAAQDTGAQDLDFFNDLCPGDPCTTNKDGHVEYLDGGHISVFASEHFESKFERLMAP